MGKGRILLRSLDFGTSALLSSGELSRAEANYEGLKNEAGNGRIMLLTPLFNSLKVRDINRKTRGAEKWLANKDKILYNCFELVF
jgi:hypothetical protein